MKNCKIFHRLRIAPRPECCRRVWSTGSGFNWRTWTRTQRHVRIFISTPGTWLKNTEIPPAYSLWGAFNVLAENNRKTLHEILEEAAKKTNAVKGSNEQKIGDFYASCLDEAKREADGMKPLVPELARIDKIQDAKGVQAEIAYLHRHGVATLFSFGSLPDLKNSSMAAAAAGQGGLSLPNRDYYTKTDEKSVKLREDFVKHVATMFQLVGDTPSRQRKTLRLF